MAQDPYKYFRVEARGLLDQMGRGVLELEERGGAAPAEVIARLLRAAHTLKGAARVVKQRDIADRAHAIEEVLAPYRDGAAGGVPREAVSSLLQHCDGIADGIAALSAPAPAPGPAPPGHIQGQGQGQGQEKARGHTQARVDGALAGRNERGAQSERSERPAPDK